MYSVENILNRSYPRFASTTTTTTAPVTNCLTFSDPSPSSAPEETWRGSGERGGEKTNFIVVRQSSLNLTVRRVGCSIYRMSLIERRCELKEVE